MTSYYLRTIDVDNKCSSDNILLLLAIKIVYDPFYIITDL